MSLGARLSLGTAIALALAIAVASTVAYFVVRGELRSEIDASLRDRQAALVARSKGGAPPRFSQAPHRVPSPRLGGAGGYFQFVTSAGKTSRPPQEKERLPVDSRAQAVAAGTGKAFFSDQTVAGTRVRVYTAQVSKGVAVQIARPLTEVDSSLGRIRLFLLVISAGGVALAATLGLLVARTTLVPVRRLTRAAERIAATRDLRSRVGDGRGDELGRLAKAFDVMLDALATSVTAQRQLVADASHELRTPLSSIRTNLEVLELDEGMPLEERRRILADAVAELGEMTHLIEELVELARGEQHALELDLVRLDLVVRDAVAAAARRVPTVSFDARLDPTLVRGSAQALTRAVANLLDNACKWSPEGGVVDVTVANGEVTVRDRGPGVDEADRAHVFDRFYRSAASRTLPGSGLGLAIVRQIAEAHGGSASVEPAHGGGSVFQLRFPAFDRHGSIAPTAAASA
jgi:two-component system, OmpR family, sensor histidine kinase MprB